MNTKWWKNKIAYQIYPKSFYDTNGDGIGDLKGITAKLDYLKDLGIDIVWISPCYESPLADQGYDISDYYKIDPVFGTEKDMEELIAEAKSRGISVLMDLVVNHCSDEHFWFKEAVKDPQGKYGKYFYIEEGKYDATKDEYVAPYNWRGYFGGYAWDKLPGSDKLFYLHSFHKKQPDLNWTNPELREEIYTMMNWWLDKGLGGFRIDAIINIKKKFPFCDYPADRPDGTAFIVKMVEAEPNISKYLTEMRDRTFALHDSFSVGEVFNATEKEMDDFIGENGFFSSMFDFKPTICGGSTRGWYFNKKLNPDDYKACIFATQRLVSNMGYISNIIENHDEPRGVCRYIPEGGLNNTSKKMLAATYFFLRGIPFIYQGQEIGMENLPFESMDEVDDVSSWDEYEHMLSEGCTPEQALEGVRRFSRDNARTPFQWTHDNQAGFTTGIPWLRVNPNYININAEDEGKDPNSVLNFYKEMVRVRKRPEYEDVFVEALVEPYLEEEPNLIAYYRRGDRHSIILLANFSDELKKVPIKDAIKGILLNNLNEEIISEGNMELMPWQVIVAEI